MLSGNFETDSKCALAATRTATQARGVFICRCADKILRHVAQFLGVAQGVSFRNVDHAEHARIAATGRGHLFTARAYGHSAMHVAS